MKNNQELREEKFAIIRRWEASGLTQRQFCQDEKLSSNNFHYWLSRYRGVSRKKQDKFIKLKPASKLPVNRTGIIPGNSVCSEIIFANGNCIRFYNTVEISELKQLAI